MRIVSSLFDQCSKTIICNIEKDPTEKNSIVQKLATLPNHLQTIFATHFVKDSRYYHLLPKVQANTLEKFSIQALKKSDTLTDEKLQTITTNCTSLQKLDLKKSQITTFTLCSISNVKKISLRQCKMLSENAIWTLSEMAKALIEIDVTETEKLSFKNCAFKHLRILHISNNTSIDDNSLVQIAQVASGLYELYANNTAITHFPKNAIFPELKILHLAKSVSIEDSILPEIATNCPKIEELDLSSTGITSFKNISFPRIKKLKLNECSELINEELHFLTTSMKNLTELSLQHSLVDISSIHFEHVPIENRIFPHVKVLDVSNTLCLDTEDAFQIIPEIFPNLETLKINIVDLANCANITFPKLITLYVSTQQEAPDELTDTFNIGLANFLLEMNVPNLKNLRIAELHFTDFKELTLPSLEYIDISYNIWITNEHLKELSFAIPKLKKIKVSGTTISQFENASFMHLEYIDLAHCKSITNKTLCELSQAAPKLKGLVIAHTKISSFVRCSFPELESIDVRSCPQLTSQEISLLEAHCPQLKRILL